MLFHFPECFFSFCGFVFAWAPNPAISNKITTAALFIFYILRLKGKFIKNSKSKIQKSKKQLPEASIDLNLKFFLLTFESVLIWHPEEPGEEFFRVWRKAGTLHLIYALPLPVLRRLLCVTQLLYGVIIV